MLRTVRITGAGGDGMNHLKLIHNYIRERRTLADIPATGFPFITISRQAGAGGHLLSYVILTDFLKEADRTLFDGWHVFDRQLCEVVAADPELQASMQELLTERYRSEFQEFMNGLFSGRSQQYLERKRTLQVVRILATLGKVIIVGRAGSLVTHDIPTGIHIRLVAPEPTRTRWMMSKLKITKEAARKLMASQDAERRRMVKNFFNRDIDDPLLYDVVWNTETTDPREISVSVLAMLKARMAKRKAEAAKSA